MKSREILFEKNLLDNKKKFLSYLNSRKIGSCSDDIFQRACLIMWNKFDSFEEGTSFCAWGMQIIKNEFQNFFRKVNRNPVLFCQEIFDSKFESLVCEQNSNNNSLEDMMTLVSRLDKDSQKFIKLYLQGNQIDEIAKKYGKSKQTFYNNFCKIKKQLRSLKEKALI